MRQTCLNSTRMLKASAPVVRIRSIQDEFSGFLKHVEPLASFVKSKLS